LAREEVRGVAAAEEAEEKSRALKSEIKVRASDESPRRF
jgi:hypothetical protein